MTRGWQNPSLLAFTLLALVGGLIAYWLESPLLAGQLWNTSALLVATVLLFEIVQCLLRREVGVDLIALLSIAGALLLGEALVAAVIVCHSRARASERVGLRMAGILLFFGGNAFER